MSKLTKGIIYVVAIIVGICVYNLAQVEAKEFNEKAMIDYLNGSSVFNICDAYENFFS